MKKLRVKKYLLSTISVLVLASGTVLYLLYNPPEFLVTYIKNTAEIQFKNYTQLVLNTKKISGFSITPFTQYVALDGLEILNGNNFNSSKLVKSKSIKVGFNVFTYLFSDPSNSKLVLKIDEPEIFLSRDKNGKLEINSPLLESKSESKSSEKTKLPQVELEITNAKLIYKDKSFEKLLDTEIKIPYFKIDLDKNSLAKIEIEIREKLNSIKFTSDVNLDTGKGNIISSIIMNSFTSKIPTFYNLDKNKVNLRGGNIQLSLNASWDDFNLSNLNFSTILNLSNLVAKVPYYNRPLLLKDLDLNLTNEKISINKLNLETNGAKIDLSGKSNYTSLDQNYFDLQAKVNDLNIKNLFASLDKGLIPDSVETLNFSGTTNINSSIKGNFKNINSSGIVSYPSGVNINNVLGKIALENGTFKKIFIDKLNSNFELDKKDVKLSNLYLKSLDGFASGNITIKNLFKNDITKVDTKLAMLEGKILTDKINSDKALNGLSIKIPNKYFPSGNINSVSNLSGKLLSPNVDTTFSSDKISFNDKNSTIPDINGFSGKVHYSEELINFEGKIASGDFGKTDINLDLKNLDLIKVKTNFSDLKHNVISSFVPSIQTKNGSLSGNVQTEFSLSNLSKTNSFSIENIPQIIKIKADTNIDLLSFLPSKKVGWINNTDGTFSVNTYEKTIKSKFNILANEIGNVRGNSDIGVTNSNLDLSLSSFPVKILETIEPKLKVKSGILNLSSNTNGNINKLVKDFSVDNLAKYINTNTKIKLDNSNLLYKLNGEDITLTNWFGDVDISLNQGKMKSNIFLDSKEYGVANGYINLDKNNNLKAKISNKKIDLKNINKFTKEIDVKNGTLSFDLLADGNISNIQENPEKIVFKTILDVNNLNSVLPISNKKHNLNIEDLTSEISYSAGKLKANLLTNSSSLGKISIDTQLNTSWDISGNVKVNTDVEKFNDFISSNLFFINHSNLNLQTSFNGNLNQYDALKAKGKITLAKNNFDINKNIKVINVSIDDSKIEKTTHNIDLVEMNFNLNSGILSSNDLTLKNKNSKIISNFNFNVNNFMSGLSDWGDVKITSKDFDFNDLSIFKALGINNGNFNNLEFTSNITSDIPSLKTDIKTSISNLDFGNDLKLDDIKVDSDLKESKFKIVDFSLIKNNNPIQAKGLIDLNNLDNPSFDLELNSINFPLKSLISLIPEKYKSSEYTKIEDKFFKDNYIKVSYNLPDKSKYFTKTELLSPSILFEYWKKLKLDPASMDLSTLNIEESEKYIDLVDGNLISKITLKGSLNEPFIKTETLISDFDFNNKIKFNEIFTTAEYSNKGIKIPRFHFIENEGGFFELSGTLDNEKNMNFEAYGKVNLNILDKVLDKNFSSDANTLITVDVKGKTDNPDINLSIDSESGGVFNDIPFDKVSILGNLKNNIVFLNEASIKSGTKNAKISGLIPLDPTIGSMNVSLGLSRESLSLVNIFTRKIQLLKGDGDVFLNFQGDYRDPIINGKVNIFDSSLYVDALGKNLENLKADVDLSNHFVKIITSEALLDGSPVKLFGQIDLLAYKPGFLKLKLSADNFHWSQGSIDVFGKMAIRITNTVNNPLIAGNIQLTKGEMNFGLGSNSSKSKSTNSKAVSTIEPEFNNLDLDIPNDTDFWVRSPLFDLKPYGKIRLKKGSIYNPITVGTMKINNGNLYIINNEFKIKEATAIFGKEFESIIFPINPDLRVRAETNLLNTRTKETVQVEANITGDLESIYNNEMKIDWTKTGGLTDSEIWTQVVGINAAQQLLQDTNTTGTTLAKFATPYFNRALFNPLTSKIADFLSLEELNVGLASDMLSNPGVSIAISKPLLYGISVGYNGTIRSQSSAQYNFFTKYRLSNNFSIKASLDERASTSLQGEFGFSF